MSDHDNHGLTPTRPRVSVLEAEILEQIRDLRERVAALGKPQPSATALGLRHVSPEDRERRLVLAASRGAFVACVQPNKTLSQSARPFDYMPRTFEGDAFETAFLWARENIESDRIAKSQVPS